MPAENSLILILPFWYVVFMPTMILSASEQIPEIPVKHSMSESEFRAQYAVAIKKFKDAYQNIECRAECQYELDDPNDLSRKKRYDHSAHLQMKGDSAVAVEDYAAETPRGGTDTNQVACATPDYAFELYKTKSQHSYLLKHILHAPDRVKRMRLIMGNDVDMYLCAGSFMYHNPFEEILEKPSFTVVNLERIPAKTGEAGDMVALDFRLTDDSWFISSGHIVFAPDLNWAVLEYHYRCDYSATDYSTYSGRNIYASHQNNEVPVPEKCEHEVLNYHADMLPISEKYSATLSDFSLGTVDDSVFRLSHYGLPDTPLAVPPPEKNNLIQWFLIGNGILLALIVLWVGLQRFRSRRSLEGQSTDVG